MELFYIIIWRINMVFVIIKYTCIFYFTAYICFKLLKAPYNSNRKCFFVVFSVILSLLAHYLDIYFVEIKYILPLLLLWFAISISTLKPQVSFIGLTFSFCLSFCIHAAASLLIDFIVFIISGLFVPYNFLSIFASTVQAFFVKRILQIKRFQSGIRTLFSTNKLNFLTILCLIFISFVIYVRLNETYYIGLVSFILTLAFLIYWWQAQITKSYRRSLELRELESLRTELAEKNADIQKIMKENERVRFINHRDNNLLSAMEYSVNNYLVTDFTDKETAIAKRDELLQELNKIRGNRASSYHNQETEVVAFNTGSSLLNTLLIHMNREAAKDNILFTVHQSTELDNFIPREISEEDLVHLVDDLLKNAFIAVKDCEVRMVQLQFYKWNKHLVVEVADSGIPFEVKSIVNMGITELTTHADTGGSGIGLVDIWNTKEKCKATYHMEEYATPAPFSKKISLTFDKKNRYSVRTWRKDEILQMSKRADLQVYGE